MKKIVLAVESLKRRRLKRTITTRNRKMNLRKKSRDLGGAVAGAEVLRIEARPFLFWALSAFSA